MQPKESTPKEAALGCESPIEESPERLLKEEEDEVEDQPKI